VLFISGFAADYCSSTGNGFASVIRIVGITGPDFSELIISIGGNGISIFYAI
jgi:hypothetical protein